MKIVKWFMFVLLGIMIIAAGFVGVLTIMEYRPETVEEVPIENNQNQLIQLNEAMTMMTFNIGYAGLGEDEDFVMDGGTKGIPESKTVVEDYFTGIKGVLENHPSDFYLLQEVDVKARRSYGINEVMGLTETLGETYSTAFAYNFKAPFVPFPVSLTDYIGYVESGIVSFTTYRVEQISRYQFPGSFSWPLRVANLKRAMMVSTYDIEGSDHKLLVINLHMSAYDASGTLREQEMAFLKSFLEEQQTLGNYVIVGGDFNQTFPGAEDIYPTQEGLWEAYPIETDFLPDGYRFEYDATQPSCRLLNQPYDPTDDMTQYYIIDGFIVSSNIETLAYDGINVGAKTLNENFKYSDHNPVVLRFKLL